MIAETEWVGVSVGKVSIEHQAEYERNKIAAAIRKEAAPEHVGGGSGMRCNGTTVLDAGCPACQGKIEEASE